MASEGSSPAGGEPSDESPETRAVKKRRREEFAKEEGNAKIEKKRRGAGRGKKCKRAVTNTTEEDVGESSGRGRSTAEDAAAAEVPTHPVAGLQKRPWSSQADDAEEVGAKKRTKVSREESVPAIDKESGKGKS